MCKRVCIVLIVFLVFVGVGNVNRIEVFVFLDGCGDEIDFEFLCWLICYGVNF